MMMNVRSVLTIVTWIMIAIIPKDHSGATGKPQLLLPPQQRQQQPHQPQLQQHHHHHHHHHRLHIPVPEMSIIRTVMGHTQVIHYLGILVLPVSTGIILAHVLVIV